MMASTYTNNRIAELLRELVWETKRPVIICNVSEKEFFKIVDEDLKCELVDGQMIVHSPISYAHEETSRFLSIILGVYVSDKDLGKVYGGTATIRFKRLKGYKKPKDFMPDIFFIKKSRLKFIKKVYFEGAPDFIIEILSPAFRKHDLEVKLKAYESRKVKEYWIVDYTKKRIFVNVLEKDKYKQTIVRHGILKSREVKGFWIKVEWLWRKRLPKTLDTVLKILRLEK